MKPTQRSVSILIATNLMTLLALGVLVLSGFVQGQTAFKEIQAERINIVDPDGKTVLAISNKQRIAPAVAGGKTYKLETTSGRESMAGMIFFNQEGDEMGGLLFNSYKLPNGKFAGIGHLSFDRYQDNQVVALQYKENSTTVQSGLTLYDRAATGKFKASLDLVEEYLSASPDRRKEIEKALSEMRERGELGAERVFVGSKDQVAQIVLKDSKGRVRARMQIDKSDQPVLEFLDESGKVVSRFPAASGQ